jgi:hypothetical protein
VSEAISSRHQLLNRVSKCAIEKYVRAAIVISQVINRLSALIFRNKTRGDSAVCRGYCSLPHAPKSLWHQINAREQAHNVNGGVKPYAIR